MRFKFILVVSLLALTIAISNPTIVQPIEAADVSDVKVLILICDGFGWNYFDAKECLESWGVNVTTVAYAIDYEIDSCLNREPRPITADLLMSEMTPDMVQEFNCLLLTSGGQWAGLSNSPLVLNFISDSFDLGLIVASICTGTRVVAEANGIVNGCKVIDFTLSSPQMVVAGATTVLGAEAVADGSIITGGRGGGPTGGGYLEAPTSEVCAEIVRESLGLSRVGLCAISPASGPYGTNFSLCATIDNLNDTLGEILSTEIEQVTALIYGFGNRTLVNTVQLTDRNHDGNYTGYLIANDDGEFVIDIEVEDSNSTFEIVKEIETFSVGPDPTKQMDAVLVFAVTGGGILILVLVAALVKKK